MSEQSSIAYAYAIREYLEREQFQQSVCFFANKQFTPASEEEKQKELAENTLMIERVLRTGNWERRMQIYLEHETTLLACALGMHLKPYAMGPPASDFLPQAVARMAGAAMRVIYAPLARRSAEDIPLFCGAASEIAEERKISPETVFSTDTLYAEMVGKTYKPEDYIRPIAQTAQGFTLDICTRVFTFGITPFFEAEVTSDNLLTTQGFTEALEQIIYPNRSAYFKWAWDCLGRFWGTQNSLPDDLLNVLTKEL